MIHGVCNSSAPSGSRSSFQSTGGGGRVAITSHCQEWVRTVEVDSMELTHIIEQWKLIYSGYTSAILLFVPVNCEHTVSR